MTPDEFRGGYAAVLMIGGGTSPMRDVPDTARWHQINRCWISTTASTKLYAGLPVVARMAGVSNELLMLGVVSGDWHANDVGFGSRWPHLLPVAWETHVTRGVYAADVIGKWGKARPAAMTISKRAWREIVVALLDA
jgi:hypothetical protein